MTSIQNSFIYTTTEATTTSKKAKKAFVSMSFLKCLVAIQLSLVMWSLTVDCLPARAPIAVQGVVYCKSCKYNKIPSLTDAKPISGATVKLHCWNTKEGVSVEGKTDENGYFFIQGPKTVSTYGVHKCRVYLVWSPWSSCNAFTDLHGGATGAILRYQKQPDASFVLFNVGPLAFNPTTC